MDKQMLLSHLRHIKRAAETMSRFLPETQTGRAYGDDIIERVQTMETSIALTFLLPDPTHLIRTISPQFLRYRINDLVLELDRLSEITPTDELSLDFLTTVINDFLELRALEKQERSKEQPV